MIAAYLLVGCSASPYRAAGIDTNNLGSFVVVETDSDKDHKVLRGLNETVQISRVDDENLYNFFTGFPDKAFISAGRHRIEVKFSYLNTYATGCLLIDAVAGEEYIVRKLSNQYGVKFWMENKRSGQPVGGNCPSKPMS